MSKPNKKRAKTPVKTLKRLLKYAFSNNKLATAFVFVFVLFASVANVTAASRISYIVTELIDNGVNADMWGIVYPNIIAMGCIYLVGAISSFSYNLIMMYIAQRTLKKMRDEMFAKMQRLPLKYFDTHTHGDLMSLYTNDVDTMRQLLTQTIPQIISSALTITAVFGFMLVYSATLLLVVLIMLAAVIVATKIVGGKSAKYYLTHQKALGNLNGYVEEMTEGQKVIKVFCHEAKAREQFKKVNDELNEAGKIANKYAFILGPINNNLGYLQYVLVALVGVLMMAFSTFIKAKPRKLGGMRGQNYLARLFFQNFLAVLGKGVQPVSVDYKRALILSKQKLYKSVKLITLAAAHAHRNRLRFQIRFAEKNDLRYMRRERKLNLFRSDELDVPAPRHQRRARSERRRAYIFVAARDNTRRAVCALVRIAGTGGIKTFYSLNFHYSLKDTSAALIFLTVPATTHKSPPSKSTSAAIAVNSPSEVFKVISLPNQSI